MTTYSPTGEVAGTLVALSTALRERTRVAHERAESSRFVTRLLDGALPVEAYAALVAQHHAIYATLERCGRARRQDPVAGPVQHDGLLRGPALTADLFGLFGDGWLASADAVVTPATRRYVNRLNGCGPAEFVAHHYVRYLGDLAGGQVVRRAAERAYGADTPTTFYRFDSLGPVKPFRDTYRATLDALPLDATGQQALVAEAVIAFDLNRAVFDDLAARFC